MTKRPKKSSRSTHDALVRRLVKDGTYEQLLEKQGGTCALPSCDRTPTTSAKNTRRLDIDINHRTWQHRGLLCRNHNMMLQPRISNVNLLRELADYLERAGE